jgi:hypothetical protein
MTKGERQSAFIKKVTAKHNDKYDYSKVVYERTHSKVEIVCSTHGSFFQTPASHQSGTGCPTCSGREKCNDKSFIEKAKAIHGDNYDYSKVQYVNAHTKVTIICPTHGDWDILPCNHITKKAGCNKCGQKKLTLTTEQFIEKAIRVHGDKYDYSLVDYKRSNLPVSIICKRHGVFDQIASSHININTGCPRCRRSKGEEKVSAFLKERGIKYIDEWKDHECRGKKQLLPFDFYLPDHNLCIEYDGIFHFKAVFRDTKELERQQQADKTKDGYCRSNNIHLLRIHYKEFNNINSLILKALQRAPSRSTS